VLATRKLKREGVFRAAEGKKELKKITGRPYNRRKASVQSCCASRYQKKTPVFKSRRKLVSAGLVIAKKNGSINRSWYGGKKSTAERKFCIEFESYSIEGEKEVAKH